MKSFKMEKEKVEFTSRERDNSWRSPKFLLGLLRNWKQQILPMFHPLVETKEKERKLLWGRRSMKLLCQKVMDMYSIKILMIALDLILTFLMMMHCQRRCPPSTRLYTCFSRRQSWHWCVAHQPWELCSCTILWKMISWKSSCSGWQGTWSFMYGKGWQILENGQKR